MKVKDITGQKFGRLTVISLEKERKNRQTQWLCECDCGNKKIIYGSLLKNGKTKSCGCLHREKVSIANTKHFGCMNCGSDKHYAKGFCRNCYNKARRGTLK